LTIFDTLGDFYEDEFSRRN